MQYHAVILALFASSASLVSALPIDANQSEVAPDFIDTRDIVNDIDSRDIVSDIAARDYNSQIAARGKAFSKTSSSNDKGSTKPQLPPKNETITECMAKCRGLPAKEASICKNNCYYNQKSNSKDKYDAFRDATLRKQS